jgi:hypothetical protein
MTWETKHSLELARVVIGVARAFGSSISLLDQPSIPDLADSFTFSLRLGTLQDRLVVVNN